MVDSTAAVLHVAIAAACMAKGLTSEQTQVVWVILKLASPPANPADAQEMLEAAIAEAAPTGGT